MMKINYPNIDKINKAVQLYKYINDKEQFHRKKWDRARKWENCNIHYRKMTFYSEFTSRCSSLIYRLKMDYTFGKEPDWMKWDAKRYKERRLKEKEAGRLEFESNYRLQLYYFQESLSADYGTFNCTKCKSVFYHSPCDVYKGAKIIHLNCCGNCANNILDFNRQETVYH